MSVNLESLEGEKLFELLHDEWDKRIVGEILAREIIFAIGLNIISVLDIISSSVIITASASEIVMPNLVVIIVTLFLLQKGIFSMFS